MIHLLREHWAEAALSLFGLAAFTLLLLVGFSPSAVVGRSKAISEPGSVCSLGLPTGAGSVDLALTITRGSGLDAVPTLLKKLRSGKADIRRTINALAALGPAVVPLVISALEDDDVRVRSVAIRTVCYLAPRLEAQAGVLMPILVRRLGDANPEIRYAAILALLSFGPSGDEAVPALVEELRDTSGVGEGDSTCLQQGAAHVLGRIGPKAGAAIPELKRLLEDGASPVRAAAAMALWRITCDTNLVFRHLSGLLAETDLDTQNQAVTALQRLRREVELSPELLAQMEVIAPDDLFIFEPPQRDYGCQRPILKAERGGTAMY